MSEGPVPRSPPLHPVRFGVLCAGPEIPTWQARCIEELRAGGSNLALIVFPAERSFDGSHPGSLLFRAYVASHRPAALRPADMAAAFRGVPSMRCRATTQGAFTGRFDESDVRRIRAYELDFLLQCGFGVLDGEILDAARYGVWSFQHDDEPPYRGIPACLWPIYDGDADPLARSSGARAVHRGSVRRPGRWGHPHPIRRLPVRDLEGRDRDRGGYRNRDASDAQDRDRIAGPCLVSVSRPRSRGSLLHSGDERSEGDRPTPRDRFPDSMGEARHARIGRRGARPHRLPLRWPVVARLHPARRGRKHAAVRVACAEPRGAVGTARTESGEGGHPILASRGDPVRPPRHLVPTGPR